MVICSLGLNLRTHLCCGGDGINSIKLKIVGNFPIFGMMANQIHLAHVYYFRVQIDCKGICRFALKILRFAFIFRMQYLWQGKMTRTNAVQKLRMCCEFLDNFTLRMRMATNTKGIRTSPFSYIYGLFFHLVQFSRYFFSMYVVC